MTLRHFNAKKSDAFRVLASSCWRNLRRRQRRHTPWYNPNAPFSWAAAFRWLLFQISRPRPGVDGEDYEARCEWLRKDFKLKVYNEPIRGKSYPKSLKTHLVSLGERIWGWAWDIFMYQYWDLDDDDMSKVREKSGGRDPLVHFTNQVFVENLHIRARVYDKIVLAHP